MQFLKEIIVSLRLEILQLFHIHIIGLKYVKLIFYLIIDYLII